VGGQRQADVAGGDECQGMRRRRVFGLRPGKVEPDDGQTDLAGDARELDVRGRRMRAHGRDDEGDQRHARAEDGGAAGDSASHSLDHVAHREPALEMEARCPSDLGVSHAVAGQIVDQLAGDSHQGLGGLEQGDREVEEGQQLGLVRASLGTDHA
jgi:hypothetical protein